YGKGLTALYIRRSLGVLRHPVRPPLVRTPSRIFRIQAKRSTRRENVFAWYRLGAQRRIFIAIPMPVSQRNLRQSYCPNVHHALFFTNTQARESRFPLAASARRNRLRPRTAGICADSCDLRANNQRSRVLDVAGAVRR